MRKFLTTALVALVGAVGVTACGNTTPVHHPVTHPHSVAQSAMGSVHPAGWGRVAPPSVRLGVTSQPTATMYDAVDTSQIPANPFAAAGYTAGNWVTYPRIRSAWPNTHAVSIAIQSYFYAGCLDVEPGDATPAEVPGWVLADKQHGFSKPCVYSSYYEYINQVRPELAAHGILRSQVFEWDADYTGTPHIDASFDATQYTDHALGRNLDASIVALNLLSIAQPPYISNPPHRTLCWGKGSTPQSATCQKIEAEAKHAWNQYLAYHKGLLLHQKQLAVVAPYPGYFEQKKATISVPAYKGPSVGFLKGRISEETSNGNAEKAKHTAWVKQYHS